MSDAASTALINNLLSRGFVTEEKLQECRNICQQLAAEGTPCSLESVLLKRGYVTPEQIHQVRVAANQRTQTCPHCQAKYNVSSLEPGKKVRCRKCSEIFVVQELSATPPPAVAQAPPPAVAPSAPVEDRPFAILEVVNGEQKGTKHDLKSGAFINIGRAPTNELRLNGVSISRVHAKIEVKGGDAILTDLNSSNGSFCNGERITSKALCNGDLIKLGDVEMKMYMVGGADAGASSSVALKCHKCGKAIPRGTEKYQFEQPICRPCLVASEDPLIGKIISGCKILKKLGEGGMGAVYKGHQISMDRLVAVKALPAKKVDDEETLKRFLREAKSGAQLVHPNIIQLYDMGQTPDGIYYILMEYVEGGDLMGRIEKVGRLPWREAIEIVAQVAEALTVAYSKRIVHRDIKPENILFNEENVVKLADMGLAKRLDDKDKLTRTGMAVGTPYYMPPEQFKAGDTVDHRSDIYALGVTFYHMVTGDLPFKGKTLIEVAKKILAEPMKSPKESVDLPEPVCNMIMKMTSKDPAKRYQTPEELLSAINDIKKSVK